MSHIGGRLVVEYLVDVQSRVRMFEANGRPAGELALPGTGVVAGLSGREDTATIFYAFTLAALSHDRLLVRTGGQPQHARSKRHSRPST